MLTEVVLFGLLLLLLLWRAFRRPSKYPPGRWGLPLIGSIPLSFSKSLEDHLTDLHNKHGDIYLWRMGTQVMVFLHDYNLCREAFTRPEFTSRPDWETLKLNEEEALGVGSSNGRIWHNNRRFTLRQLRELGMGKSSLVDAVQRQAVQLVDVLSKQSGTPAPLPHAIKVAAVNVIWQMVGGKQFDEDDPKLKELDDLTKLGLDAQARMTIQDFLPWVRHIMPAFLFSRLVRQDLFELLKEKFLNYFSEDIAEHRVTLDPDNLRDLIDGYLMEMHKRKDDPDSTFNEKDLSLLSVDLFFAGSDIVSMALTWLLYYLATYEHVQRRLQAEIDEVLPKGHLVTLEDKPRLSYTEAVINEVHRKSALVPLGDPHAAERDTQLGGYFIPKGAVINSATFSIHHDPRYWDKPDEFLPERWLDEDGKFVVTKKGFLPFGVGKRQCLGEGLARMELLVFTTTLFQRLSFSVPPGKKLNLQHNSANPFMHIPHPQDLVVTVREQ